MKVSDLTVEEFKELIRESLEEFAKDLTDEDHLPLCEDLVERLRAQLAAGEPGIPLEEVAKQHGLTW